jgi:hypothetical protein
MNDQMAAEDRFVTNANRPAIREFRVANAVDSFFEEMVCPVYGKEKLLRCNPDRSFYGCRTLK